MNSEAAVLVGRAEELRAAFDRRFAEPLPPLPGRQHELLAVRAADGRYAVRLDEIAGLATNGPVTGLPSPLPQLLGLTGYRGQAVAVYDLAVMLGHAQPGPRRWRILTPQPAMVAFAFDDVAGHFRMPAAGSPEPGAAGPQPLAHFDGSVWPVLSIPSLLDAITELRRGVFEKER